MINIVQPYHCSHATGPHLDVVLADVPGPLPQDGGDGGEAPQLGGRQGGLQ